MTKTFTPKYQQEELEEFFDERCNPNLKLEITSTIFKRILLNSKKFMQLRVLMRDDYRNAKLRWESAVDKINLRQF